MWSEFVKQMSVSIIKACLLIAYCVPFAFLCVYGDATSGTMIYYGVMIAGYALLCWGTLRTIISPTCISEML